MKMLVLVPLMLAFAVPAQAATCKVGALPDKTCSPGAVSTATSQHLCDTPAKPVALPPALKRKVFSRYGIRKAKQKRYVINHVVPFSFGGTGALENLWPQTPAMARKKAKLEITFYAAMCERAEIDALSVQRVLTSDWLAAYKRFVDFQKTHSTM